ncbi:MAG: hypothetical protein M3463_04925 [Verrucomicrobiota bacterium]|nr:hypothetical protein [Verrucomicrobiota bacterium]
MHLLRSRIFSILVVALLFAGYSEFVLGCCDHEPAAAVSEPGEPSHSHSDEQGCHCVCHQTFVNDLTSPALIGRLLEAELVFAELADVPPDAIPLGIDHPPQIA